MKRILILGGTGMLGHILYNKLSACGQFDVYATVRNGRLLRDRMPYLQHKLIEDVDAGNLETIVQAIGQVQPEVVINCIGLIKQLPTSNKPLNALAINSMLPHKIALLCKAAKARMIHISTDCVFDGEKGNYRECDPSDAKDLYGRSKFLGEVSETNCITLRTSIIGHELNTKFGLVEWFLQQTGKVQGYTQVIYTGFPTVEIAKIIQDYVIPRSDLEGLFQVSSEPISKYELLLMIAAHYGKEIEIEPYGGIHIDRSLNSDRFRQATGYNPPTWTTLVDQMHRHYIDAVYYPK